MHERELEMFELTFSSRINLNGCSDKIMTSELGNLSSNNGYSWLRKGSAIDKKYYMLKKYEEDDEDNPSVDTRKGDDEHKKGSRGRGKLEWIQLVGLK